MLPLTPLQSGILFHSLHEPHGGLYAEQLTCTLSGALDEAAFRGAWQGLIARHDALRITIGWRDHSEPVQIVHATAHSPLQILDWSALAAGTQATDLAALEARERLTPFDLTRAPLMRATLVRLGAVRYALVWTHHHLILDGWSVGLLVQDLVALYQALAQGRPPALAPARSFEPFVHWLARWDRRATLDHWHASLAGFQTPTLVPAEIGEPESGKASLVDSVVRRSTDDQDRGLRESARVAGCTPFTLVAAAWAVVLAHVVNARDVLFGATVSGRPGALPDVEAMVGLFINTVPFRVRLDLDEPLGRWLASLEHQKQVTTEQHAHAPLAEVLAPSRALTGPAGGAPFNTLLVYENYPLPTRFEISPELALNEIRCVERTNYDVTLVVLPAPSFEFTLSFDTRRHSRLGARRLLANLQATLSRLCTLVHQADSRVGALLEPAGHERHRVLVEYGRGATLHSAGDARLEQLIWSRASGHADAIALSSGHVHWSFGHLRARAGAVARALVALGIGTDQRVGLCVRRGPWLVAGALGILEAGAAYVPFDPGWPAERRRWVVADAGLAVVLVDADDSAAWDSPGLVLLPVGGSLPSSPAAASRVVPATACGGRQLAYVIYTSGSTGRPKGAMLEHAGVINRLLWMQRAFPLSARERVLQKTPATFDVSVWELFWPALVGARLILAEPERHRDSHYLANELRLRRVSTVHFVPPMLRALLDDPGLAACRGRATPGLRRVICSGEALPGDLVQQFWSSAQTAKWASAPGDDLGLFNLYGPTEASVDVTAWSCEVPRALPAAGGEHARRAQWSVPIGRAIDGIRLYVASDDLRALPAGAVGELCIAGIGLARGYLRRPALTAERFVPDPFVDQPGERLYRTGDLARWGPDGALEFLGRIDDQVKIRGMRVEPGEVEQTLRQHPDVQAAAVVALAHEELGTRLVAYVVTREQAQPWLERRSALERWLRERLPEYLVPALFLDMPGGLPIGSSGKLDRRALPPPEALATDPAAHPWLRGTPLSAVEETISQVWADVLQLEPGRRLAPDDNFFQLGGDSLTSLKATTRVSACFQVAAPVELVFKAPTLRAMAARIEDLLVGAAVTRRTDALPALDPARPAVLSSAQRRLWITHQFDPTAVQHNVACAVWLEGVLDQTALAQALELLAQRHESLRTEFLERAGEPAQRVRTDVALALRVEQSSNHVEFEHDCRRFVLEQMRVPFDLRHAPLVRATLLRGQPERSALVLTLHHLVCDGWSAGLLVRDVAALYRELSEGRTPAPTNPSLRYVDYARWQNDGLLSDTAQARLAHVRGRLRELPADHGLPSTSEPDVEGAAAVATRRLSGALLARLRDLRRAQGVTTFMLVLAAFKAVLHDMSGRTDIVVGTDAAERSLADAWDVVGFFVNQLVLRTDLAGDPSFATLLARVRATCVEAYAYQDVPYEALVKDLRPGPRPAGDLFLLKLVQQQPVSLAFDLGALRVRPLVVSDPSSEFDLILNFTEQAEEWVFEAEFRRDRLGVQLVTRLLERLERLLAAAAENPQMCLSGLGAAARQAEPSTAVLPARRRSVAQLERLNLTRGVS